jgi:hypothetical protein
MQVLHRAYENIAHSLASAVKLICESNEFSSLAGALGFGPAVIWQIIAGQGFL